MFLKVQDKEQIQESGNQESGNKNQEERRTAMIENYDSKKAPVS